MLKAALLSTAAFVLACCTAWPAAASSNSLCAFVEYVATYGDTYDGVTTDDGDHLGSSFALRGAALSGRFAALYMFYRDKTASLTNATTPSGGAVTTLQYPAEQIVVPIFTAVNAQSEFRLEYRPSRLPFYAGLAYSNAFNNYGFPRLTGFGVGIEVQPDPQKRLSPYGSYFFFPNQSGTYALAAPTNPKSGSAHSAFRGNEFLIGGSARVGKTGLDLRFGYYQTTNVRRTGTFNFVRDGPFVGLAYRL